MAGEVTLDFSKAEPLTLDFSKAEMLDQPKKATFTQRALESSGLSGVADLAKNTPQSFSDVLSSALAPAKQAVGAAVAPAQHLNDIISKYKAGDKEGVLSSVAKFVDAFIPGTGNANELSQNTLKDVQDKNVGAVAGTVTGLAAQSALAASLTKAPVGLKNAVSRLSYTADGELTPLAKSVLHPTELPETLFRKVVPEPPAYPGASLPAADEFYANKAKDLMQREAQQRVLDSRARIEAARTARAQAKIPDWETPAHETESRPTPFAGATSTATPVGKAALPPARELPQGSPTPFVSKFTEQPASRIVSPESPPPEAKVTYQSVPGRDLMKMVLKGDKNAIAEWRRRGLPLPANVKFMIENSGSQPYSTLSQ